MAITTGARRRQHARDLADKLRARYDLRNARSVPVQAPTDR
jgi:hypothetical protein